MSESDVLKKVLQSDSLPILPSVASKLVEITARKDVTQQQITDLISKDISLSAKLLKIANSSFYSFPSQIATIKQAVSVIGINAVRSLILSFSFLTIKAKNKADIFNYERFWEKSLAAAVSAKLIMARIDQADPEEIFIASLLQNIGELIIARVFPEKHALVLAESAHGERPLVEVEQQIIGADHQYIGFEVTKNWGFPETLLGPIKYHHQPEQEMGTDKKLKLFAKVTYLSDLLSEILYSSHPAEAHAKFQEKAKAMLGFDDQTINTILDQVHSQIAQIAKFFNLKIKESRSVEDILMEANAALSVLNLSYEQMNKELVAAKVKLQKLAKDLEEKNKHLEKLAHIDGLTEVYNHRFFQDFLAKEINRAIRKETTLGLVLADVDNFKVINDTYSHQTGDRILQEICRRMGSLLREYDLLARYGGEEFVIVLPETDAEGAVQAAEKLRNEVAAAPIAAGREKIAVTLSFGVAVMNPSVDTFKQNELIAFADEALYDAKKKGKDRVALYTPKKSWFGRSRK